LLISSLAAAIKACQCGTNAKRQTPVFNCIYLHSASPFLYRLIPVRLTEDAAVAGG